MRSIGEDILIDGVLDHLDRVFLTLATPPTGTDGSHADPGLADFDFDVAEFTVLHACSFMSGNLPTIDNLIWFCVVK
ncbi:hypothetical protein JCM9743_21640 [Natrinema sp. JCM 9743]